MRRVRALKIICLLLIVLLSITFTSCNKAKEDDYANSNISGEPEPSFQALSIETEELGTLHYWLYTLFEEKRVLRYSEFRSAGIAFYKHAYMNDLNGIGTNVFFIFLSKGSFNEKYRCQANLWKPSKADIKVEFDKDFLTFY